MENIKYSFAEPYSSLQNAAIPTLVESFDEWKMFTEKYGFTFPFYEASFVAIDQNTNKVIAHAGIMPFTIRNSNNETLKVAGLASVATSCNYRKKGIAAGKITFGNDIDLQSVGQSLPVDRFADALVKSLLHTCSASFPFRKYTVSSVTVFIASKMRSPVTSCT